MQFLDRINAAPKAASRVSPKVVTTLVKVQVGQVRAIVEAITALETAIKQVLAAHPYAELFRTLPRIGTVNLAQIIGEIGPMLERGLNPDQLAAEVGMTPVTRASGKLHRRVPARRQPARAKGPDPLRRQQPPRQPLGRRPLPMRP